MFGLPPPFPRASSWSSKDHLLSGPRHHACSVRIYKFYGRRFMSEHSLSLRLKVLHTLKLACYCDSLARVSRRDNPLHFPKLINVLIRVTSEQVKHRVLHNHVLQHLYSSHPHTLTSSTFQYPHRTHNALRNQGVLPKECTAESRHLRHVTASLGKCNSLTITFAFTNA